MACLHYWGCGRPPGCLLSLDMGFLLHPGSSVPSLGPLLALCVGGLGAQHLPSVLVTQGDLLCSGVGVVCRTESVLPPLSSSCPRRLWVLAVFLSTCLWKEELSSGVPSTSASCTGLSCLWHSSCRSPLISHPQGLGWCPHDSDSCCPDTSQAASEHVCSGHPEPRSVGSLG